VLKEDSFTDLTREQLAVILKSESLNAKEIEIFEGLLAWAKAAAKRDKKSVDKADELRSFLGEELQLIRFPNMDIQHVATTVSRSELLSQEQLLGLFTYLGSKDKKSTKIDASLKAFSTKPRKARLLWADFTFDSSRKGPAMAVENDDRTVKQTSGNSQWNTIGCKEWVTEGVHKVYFKIDMSCGSNWIFVGVMSRSYAGFTDTSSGYIGCNSNAWGWTNGGSTSRTYPSGNNFGLRSFRTGDVLEMTLDMDAHTISYRIVGESTTPMLAFSSVASEVTVAVTLYDVNNQVTLCGPDGETM